ncbi:uncharacterized protein VTP21DRAFT_9422 [Calcarisporiella thermophila]|uniref:uncharacterized protein n=1 Tax=Calcarisporiella thermophila TaxID=911321 RepID=UPI00374416E6
MARLEYIIKQLIVITVVALFCILAASTTNQILVQAAPISPLDAKVLDEFPTPKNEAELIRRIIQHRRSLNQRISHAALQLIKREVHRRFEERTDALAGVLAEQ